jgi:hypothetical protein
MNRPSPVCALFLTVIASSAFGRQSKPAATLKPTPAVASVTAVSPEAEEVLAFERSMEAAVVRGDRSYVDSVSAPDLTFTHGDAWTTGGKPLLVDDKRTFLQRGQNKAV